MMDLLLYSSIRDYIYARISFFTEHVLSKNLTLVFTIIVALLTLWIMIQGYLIATGRSQEGLKGFVYGLGKTYLIVAVALGVAAGSDFSVRVLTDTLSDGISQIMTGDSDVGSKCLTQDSKSIIGCRIDQNLTATQSMMGILDGIDTADSEYLEGKVTQARWFVGVGTAGPAIVAGTMLIMFRIAMALFIGFAPIFILCLLFKKTAPLFQKWLYYGLATIFSSVIWRHGGNLYGSSRQYRHYRCSIQYCFGTDRWKRRRYYADSYPTAGLGPDALYPIDYRTAYGRCLV